MGRKWYDGEPYYCATCDLGFEEYCTCGEADCELETRDESQGRAAEPYSVYMREFDERNESFIEAQHKEG